MGEIAMIMNQEDIKKIIPHRAPFLLVDEVQEFDRENQRIVALKHVRLEEYYFQGHFPGRPIMPGVLIVESLAQAGAIALLSMEEFKGKYALFAGIKDCRFRQQVVPGDTLRLEVELTKIKGPVGYGTGKAYVGDKLAVNVEMTFAIG